MILSTPLPENRRRRRRGIGRCRGWFWQYRIPTAQAVLDQIPHDLVEQRGRCLSRFAALGRQKLAARQTTAFQLAELHPGEHAAFDLAMFALMPKCHYRDGVRPWLCPDAATCAVGLDAG